MATGRKTVVVGQVIDPTTWGNPLWDQSVQTFASASDRTTQFPNPLKGAVTWLDDVGRLDVWNGTAWEQVNGGPWTAYTPTIVGHTYQAGAEFRYIRHGKTVHASGAGKLATMSAGAWTITLPFPGRGADRAIGTWYGLRTGVSSWSDVTVMGATGSLIFFAVNGNANSVTNTIPVTWAVGDPFTWTVVYETT